MNSINAIVKEYITRALLLLMEKKPYSEITISELTEKAGVCRNSFYRNFDSLEDVIIQSFEKEFKSLFSEGSDLVFSSLDFWEKVVALRSRLITLYDAKQSHLFYDGIYALVFDDLPRKKGDNRYPSARQIGMVYGMVDEWLKEGAIIDAKSLKERYEL